MPVGTFPLKDKIVVVTGGGSGINLDFTRLAHHSGASKILIADLKLTPSAATLISNSNNAIAYTHCDVTSWSDLSNLPTQVRNAFGPQAVADIWVAGAGVFEPKWSSFLYDTEDDQDHYKTLSINTEHPIKLTRIAMRDALGANKPAVILLVASMAGIRGQYACPIYCASKHAIVGFTKSMAMADPEENIKVVAALPGIVKTPLWTDQGVADVAAQFGYRDELAISSEDVAESMMELVQSAEWPGGSLMGITKKDLRERLESQTADFELIKAQGDGAKAFQDRCYGPLREVYKKERGVHER